MVGRRGEVGGGEIFEQRRGGKKKYMRARRMGFLFIRKTASTGSSSTSALVDVGSF